MTRSINEIAREIIALWPKPYYAAVPYLAAMRYLETVNDRYGADSAKSIVLYFLGNAGHWRGPDAKRLKDELREIVGAK